MRAVTLVDALKRILKGRGITYAKVAGAKYPKATECLVKDRAELLAFYEFTAEHWIHIRSSNVIESSFATIRHRTDRTKGCLTRDGCSP